MKMKNKNKISLIILSMFLVVLTSFVVSAQPPFETDLTGSLSYVIEYPQLSTAYYNQPFQFNSHIYFNNGTALIAEIDNVTCHVDGYDNTGNNTLHQDLILLEDNHFYALINESFFNWIGDGYYTLHCIDEAGIVGLVSIPYVVAPLSELPVNNDRNLNFDISNTNNIIVLILILLGSLLLMYFGHFNLAGFIWFILGLMLLFTGNNFIFSILISVIGLIIVIIDKK